jgi:hypothetical protein
MIKMNIKIVDIIEPFLIGKYERVKENIKMVYIDIYLSDLEDFSHYEISNFFSELLISAVEPVNKPLTFFFVKNNLKKIIESIKEAINLI